MVGRDRVTRDRRLGVHRSTSHAPYRANYLEPAHQRSMLLPNAVVSDPSRPEGRGAWTETMQVRPSMVHRLKIGPLFQVYALSVDRHMKRHSDRDWSRE